MNNEILLSLIEQGYTLFNGYKIRAPLGVCHECCLYPDEEHLLINTPLKLLSPEILHAYFSAAEAASDNDLIAEMKYFLPRLFELIYQGEGDSIYMTEVLLYRLYLQHTECWPEKELQFINRFALNLFLYQIDQIDEYDYYDDSLSKTLIMFATAGLNIAPLLQAWLEQDALNSLLQLYYLVVNDIDYDQAGYAKALGNTFTYPELNKVIIGWLAENKTLETFIKQINSRLKSTKDLSEENRYKLGILKDHLELKITLSQA